MDRWRHGGQMLRDAMGAGFGRRAGWKKDRRPGSDFARAGEARWRTRPILTPVDRYPLERADACSICAAFHSLRAASTEGQNHRRGVRGQPAASRAVHGSDAPTSIAASAAVAIKCAVVQVAVKEGWNANCKWPGRCRPLRPRTPHIAGWDFAARLPARSGGHYYDFTWVPAQPGFGGGRRD